MHKRVTNNNTHTLNLNVDLNIDLRSLFKITKYKYLKYVCCYFLTGQGVKVLN